MSRYWYVGVDDGCGVKVFVNEHITGLFMEGRRCRFEMCHFEDAQLYFSKMPEFDHCTFTETCIRSPAPLDTLTPL